MYVSKKCVNFQKLCTLSKIVYTFKNCEHFQSWWRMICLVIRNFRIWSYDKKVCCIPTWFLWRYSSGGKLMLSRKLASRRKRDDQSTIGQLPASRSITWHSARARILQPARRPLVHNHHHRIPIPAWQECNPKPIKAIFSPLLLPREWMNLHLVQLARMTFLEILVRHFGGTFKTSLQMHVRPRFKFLGIKP